MERRRNVLRCAVALIATAGIGLAALPFVRSLGPNDEAIANVPRIDVSALSPGDFSFVGPIARRGSGIRYLALRDYDDTVHVFEFTTAEGGYLMPGRDWFHIEAVCLDFGPDLENNKLARSGRLRCRRSEWGSVRDDWEWTYSGKNLRSTTADLYVPQDCEDGKFVYIGYDC